MSDPTSMDKHSHHLDHHHEKPDSSATFSQTNLVSDGSVPAATISASLINPWGISHSPTGPFWVSDNGTGLTTLYNGAGAILAAAGHADITVAAPAGVDTSTPTGQVFNSAGAGFTVTDNGVTAPSVFLFATEDGTISGWAPTVAGGATSIIAVDNSQGDDPAVYKGLAIGTTTQGTFLYAANFSHGTVDMFDSQFNQMKSFTDPDVPAGYAPFNVQVLDDKLYVTYAKQDDAKHDDAAGPGRGFVDSFDLNGNMLERVASRGVLNSPWGLDIAPKSFGQFSGDLLVGNFGDGTIDAFDPHNGRFIGQLLNSEGDPLQIDGLWALANGTGSNGFDPNAVYFTAGGADETHGLFGSLSLLDNAHHSSGTMMPSMHT